MSSPVQATETRRLHRANDWIDLKALKPPAALFDDFWREGELALLFGAAGVGKSLLAVQIGDALARGRAIAGFEMSATQRRQVLYVDLVLSDEQWAMRYSREARGGLRRAYKFSAGLYRDRPFEGEPLVDWLRAIISAEKISVVIIDDLSVITRSDDGTRETLGVIRELRKMTRELGVSVLVLADSLPLVYTRRIGERDLRSNRVLCAYADSVFAIEAPTGGDRRYLVKTRSQAGEPIWTHRSPVRIILTAGPDGSVGFEREEMTREQRDLIRRIKQMHDGGQTFRNIADMLEISKSTVARLYAKWTPQLEEYREEDEDDPAAFDPTQRGDYFPGCEEYDEALDGPKFDREFMDGDEEGYDPHEQAMLSREGYLIESARADAHMAYEKTGVAPRLRGHPGYKEFIECVGSGGAPFANDGVSASDDLSPVAFPLDVRQSCAFPDGDEKSHGGFASTGGVAAEVLIGPAGEAQLRRTSNGAAEEGLKRATDGYDREIFIEKEDERGQPLVWYRFDKHGNKFRHERRGTSIMIDKCSLPP
jgi:AAA domain